MPKISAHTPPWLSRSSPGFQLFAQDQSKKFLDPRAHPDQASHKSRPIAYRGTEVFVAVANEIRWSDLLLLKDGWQQDQGPESYADKNQLYRVSRRRPLKNATTKPLQVLKVPVYNEMKQLTVSPDRDYLSILTSHTLHIALLPDPSLLSNDDFSPLKPRTFQLGPTIHTLDQSPIIDALWHPLGFQGHCIATITADSVVRIWELDRDNWSSFDVPTSALDLKRLANGVSSTQDFSPARYRSGQAFSPDDFELEAVAACFGGCGDPDETGWGPMTLWIAMQGGDLYALCPVLPARWEADEIQMRELAASIVAKNDPMDADTGVKDSSKMEQSLAMSWIIDVLDRNRAKHSVIQGQTHQVYQRPNDSIYVPKLQGPVEFQPLIDEDLDITDIHVMPSSQLAEDDGESEDQFGMDEDERPLRNPMSIICITTSDGSLRCFISVEDIEGHWLPSNTAVSKDIPSWMSRLTMTEQTTGTNSFSDQDPLPELLLIDSKKLTDSAEGCRIVITPDVHAPSDFLITHSAGVTHISLASLTTQLREEVLNSTESNNNTRLKILMDGTRTQTTEIIGKRTMVSDNISLEPEWSPCISLRDSDLGHVVLTSYGEIPQSVTLAHPTPSQLDDEDDYAYDEDDEEPKLLFHHPHDPFLDPQPEYRPPYEPPSAFYDRSNIPTFLESQVRTNSRRSIHQNEIRLSSASLNVLMDVHRLFVSETHVLDTAAGELHRRCQRLVDEFNRQVSRAAGVAERVDGVLDDEDGEYEDGYDDGEERGAAAAVQRRLEAVRERQGKLTERMSKLKRRLGSAQGRKLTNKEKEWMDEVEDIDSVVTGPSPDQGEEGEQHRSPAQQRRGPFVRFESIKALRDELVAQANGLAASQEEGANDKEPSGFKQKGWSKQINAMLERETALVNAAKEKLERLQNSI